MRVVKPIVPVFLMLFFVYGCGEEEQPPPPLSDLTVRSLTIDGEATYGQPVSYTVLIANIGAGTARDFVVKIYRGKNADDLSNNIDQYMVPELEPDKTHTRTLSFTATGDPFSYIIAVVNADERITEAREDNNVGSEHIEFRYDESDEREGAALIPAGDFEMGDAMDEEGYFDELPVHTVYLDAFYMDKYEVTNVQYARFLNEYGAVTDPAGHALINIDDDWCRIVKDGDTYKPMAGYAIHPVVNVSWYGAAAYAQHYGRRLPTEAEWEKAARGGLVGRRYPWGDDTSHDEANYEGTGGRDVWEETSPAGSFPANGYALYDMAGNVWEWCADEYDMDYYAESPARNPKGPSTPVTFTNDDYTTIIIWRVLRGGAWYCPYAPFLRGFDLRCAIRYYAPPYLTRYDIGFRTCQ